MAAVTAPSPTGAPVLKIHAQFPRKFRPLLEEKATYKVFYGGRGGAKSWQFARALLIKGLSGGLRVLCTREVQSSLKESVKQLLIDQIKLLGLEQFYRSTVDEIRGPDGTLFIFKGLSDPEALKSAEGVDICWIEEARTVSKASWAKLDPTIRKAGAEVWISFNPELETDYLYTLFVKNEPPPNSIVVKVGYEDNPWISAKFKEKADALKASDYDEWLWVYGGFCKVALEGAVYEKQLRACQAEGRITRVPMVKGKPVHTFWDLGKGDMTAIWFVQIEGLQYRILHYIQANGLEVGDYLNKLEELRLEKGWFYGTMWLPHDAEHQRLGMPRTIKRQVEDGGYRVRIVPNIKVADGIAAARLVFASAWFDEAGCSDGLNCLRQYHYEVDDDGTRSRLPVHDWSSHGADGWRYLGVALKEDTPKPKRTAPPPKPALGRHGWLAG